MDPHEAGQIYPADLAEVAARWGLDAAKLRKKLNLASLPHHHIEIMSKRALRDSLKEFADTASKFASIIEQSEDQVIYRIWAGVPEINPGVLPHLIDAIRRNTSTEVRRLASLATHQYEMLSGAMEEKPPRGRVSDAVTVQERMVVGSLADLWLESHGHWAKVYDPKRADNNARAANEGGRFVIETAKILNLHLSPQRLRTILKTLKPPTAT